MYGSRFHLIKKEKKEKVKNKVCVGRMAFYITQVLDYAMFKFRQRLN